MTASGSTQTPFSRKPPLTDGLHTSWSGGPCTVTVIWYVSVETWLPTFALMVKLKVPAWVGFPVMTMLVADCVDMVRPGGRLPAVSVKMTGKLGRPTLFAAMVAEYLFGAVVCPDPSAHTLPWSAPLVGACV